MRSPRRTEAIQGVCEQELRSRHDGAIVPAGQQDRRAGVLYHLQHGINVHSRQDKAVQDEARARNLVASQHLDLVLEDVMEFSHAPSDFIPSLRRDGAYLPIQRAPTQQAHCFGVAED
jgi:hypothetical protein